MAPKKTRKMSKAFKTKIPLEYHNDIMVWRLAGMSTEGIIEKLKLVYSFPTNQRTLIRLIKHLTDEKKKVISSVITNQLHEQITGDLKSINKLHLQLEDLAAMMYKADNHMYLRTTDRLIKILQLKLSLDDTSHKDKLENLQAIRDEWKLKLK